MFTSFTFSRPKKKYLLSRILNKFIKSILFLSILFQTTSAIGVGVTPGNLNFSTEVGFSDTRSLFVINTGSEFSNYRVYVDDDYAQWCIISPDNFSLNADEFEEVIITLTPPLSAEGEFEFNIYTVSSYPSSDFSVGSGIKIPVHISVSKSGIWAAGSLLVLLVLIMISVIIGKRYLR